MTERKPATRTVTRTTEVKNAEQPVSKKVELQTIYTFMFARNLYSVKFDDIKKITLLGHNFIEKKDDKEEIQKTLYIFSVIGNQIPGIFEEDSKTGQQKPIYETIMEVKAEEDFYTTLYTIYEDIAIKWDKYQLLKLNVVCTD